MPVCNEHVALRCEMSEVHMEPNRSLLVLIDHCNQMKQHERRSRIVTCFLFVVFSTVFFYFNQMHGSLDCKNKNDEEHSASAYYQRKLESRPNAHLTGLNCSMHNKEYLEWESRNGDARLHMFNYSNNALIALQHGNYSIYLQITYRLYRDFRCVNGFVELKQKVFHQSDRYPEETVIMMALDSINCGSKSLRKSVSTSGVVSLGEGDQLRVKVDHMKLVDCNEKSVFFGAFLI